MYVTAQVRNDLFPRHVRLLMIRVKAEKRRRINKSARKIQNAVLYFLGKCRDRELKRRILHANKLWRLAKAYFLRLAIYDRVMATRARRRAAANKIKRHFRRQLFLRLLKIRFHIRRKIFEISRLRDIAALLIQRSCRRKMNEWTMPLRVAAR
jgi:hypothetical protein